VKRQPRGVAAVEFALVLPLLIMLLMGILDYGWYFFIHLTTTNAAREGARTATTYAGACPNGAAQSAAVTSVSNSMAKIGQAANTQTVVTCSTGPLGEPEFQVTVTVLFPQLTGYSLLPMPKEGDQVRSVATAIMRGVN
jgi:Flp pilus assembly protein TadG